MPDRIEQLSLNSKQPNLELTSFKVMLVIFEMGYALKSLFETGLKPFSTQHSWPNAIAL